MTDNKRIHPFSAMIRLFFHHGLDKSTRFA